MNNLFEVLKSSLWFENAVDCSRECFIELKNHAVACLSADLITTMNLPQDLKKEWSKLILQQLCFYNNYTFAQKHIPITVPYVILKGTSAAKYYPHPEYRAMGDIDIITRREDYDKACSMLLQNDYREIEPEDNNDRHREFIKNGIMMEVHNYFASLNDPNQAKYLDDLIMKNINPSHELPDLVNGMVLLEHISQHLENGLGLRQIIDWMMFVNKCLPDEQWPAFKPMVEETGLEQLTIITTRMCEIYLGLPRRDWCADADAALCDQLMAYILNCGNFGNKRNSDEAIAENIFVRGASLKSIIHLLQERGTVNWKAAQRYTFLKPLAWLYQLGRYLSKGLNRDRAFSKLRIEYGLAKQRRIMLEALGAKQIAKGVLRVKNGHYCKR